VAVSAVLLLVTGAAFLLPWPRLPGWMSVLVPLTYTGSVLALILAGGVTSGAGIVILIPLIWTALFHRLWESAVITAAIVAVELISSLVPVVAPDAVIVRRVLLWTALGVLLSVATHGLRDRIARSRQQREVLEQELREATVMADRDRIAADLRDKVIHRIFAAGLSLQSAAAVAEPKVRRRVDASIEELDQTVRMLRDTIFGLDRRLRGRGLREEILQLSGELSPVPEVSFSGPVDGALHPGRRAELLRLLRESLGLITQHAEPTRIGVTTDRDTCMTVIDASPLGSPGSRLRPDFSAIRERAAQGGADLRIETIMQGTRFAWDLPLAQRGTTASP
jgi:signal transduction histidine kinase